MIMMNFFCGMLMGKKGLALLFPAGTIVRQDFEPAQNLRSGFEK